MSKAPLPILYPLITDRKRCKPSEKIVEVSFQNFQEFLSNLQIILFLEPLFKLLEELEISHLFFGFASFCMESQKQLYHNPLTHLPSTNPHNWACKNSPCPKSNANPSHTPPPAHSQRLQHDERLLKKLQSNAAEGSRLADTSFC